MSAAAAASESPTQRKMAQLLWWKTETIRISKIKSQKPDADRKLTDSFRTSDQPNEFDVNVRDLTIADPFHMCMLLELTRVVFKLFGLEINPVTKLKSELTDTQTALVVALCKFTEVYGVGVLRRVELALEGTAGNALLRGLLESLEGSFQNLRRAWGLTRFGQGPVKNDVSDTERSESAALDAAAVEEATRRSLESVSKYGRSETDETQDVKLGAAVDIQEYAAAATSTEIKPQQTSEASPTKTDDANEWSANPTWEIVIANARQYSYKVLGLVADAVRETKVYVDSNDFGRYGPIKVRAYTDYNSFEEYVKIEMYFKKRFLRWQSDVQTDRPLSPTDTYLYNKECEEIDSKCSEFMNAVQKALATVIEYDPRPFNSSGEKRYRPIATEYVSYSAYVPVPKLFYRSVRKPEYGTVERDTYFLTNPESFDYDPFYGLVLQKDPVKPVSKPRQGRQPVWTPPEKPAVPITISSATVPGSVDTKHRETTNVKTPERVKPIAASAASAAFDVPVRDESLYRTSTWSIVIPCDTTDSKNSIHVEAIADAASITRVYPKGSVVVNEIQSGPARGYVQLSISFPTTFVQLNADVKNNKASASEKMEYESAKTSIDEMYSTYLNDLEKRFSDNGIKIEATNKLTAFDGWLTIQTEDSKRRPTFYYKSTDATIVDEMPEGETSYYMPGEKNMIITKDPSKAVYGGNYNVPCVFVLRSYWEKETTAYFRTNPRGFHHDPFYDLVIKTPVVKTGAPRVTPTGPRHVPAVGYRMVTLRPEWSSLPEYSLLFWLPRPYHPNRADANTLFDSKSPDCELCLPTSIPRNVPVGISVFSWRFNYQNQWCQYGVGSALITIGQLLGSPKHMIDVLNVTGHKQGTLLIHVPQWKSHDVSLESDDPEWSRRIVFPKNLSDKWITGGYTPRSSVAQRFRRTHISWWRGQEMPVWIFPLLKDCDSPYPTEYFRRAIRHTCRWFGFKSEKEWSAKALVEDRGFEVLSQVCGYEDWHQPYLYDKELVKGTFQLYDEFSRLRYKPDVKARAGDCEDFTAGLQKAFEAVLKLPSGQSAELDTLIDMAKGYCFFVIDTSISNGKSAGTTDPIHDDVKEVALHMYGLLLPWAMVYAMLMKGGYKKLAARLDPSEVKRTHNWPKLSLESTEMSVGNWLIDYPKSQQFIRTLPKMGAAGKKIRAHTSHLIYKEDGFYRMAIGAYSATLFEMTGVHSWLFTGEDAKEWKFGVPNRDLMNYSDKSRIAIRPVGRATDADRMLIKSVQDRMPPSFAVEVLEHDNEVTYVQDPSLKVIMAFTRAFEWTADDQIEFDQKLKEFGYVYAAPRQMLTRLKGATSYVFQLYKKTAE